MEFKKILKKSFNKQLGIFVVWLFNITALLGIALGYEDWFMSKTLINMAVYTLFLSVLYPLNTKLNWSLFLICFFVGMGSEWVGVHTSLIFGDYYYGENLGFKIFKVPFFIGMNWAVLSFISADSLKKHIQNKYALAVAAATLMVLLDVLMEMAAPKLDFWYFKDGIVPFKNYASWFLVSLMLQLFVVPKLKGGNPAFSTQLITSQFAFFIAYLLLEQYIYFFK